MSTSSMLPDCPIKLLPHQVEHIQIVWKHLVKDRNFSFLNSSSTGAGKSLVTLYIAWQLQKKYGTKVFLVAPSDTSLNAENEGWLYHAKKNDIKIEFATTYSSLRGGRGTVSHDWLIPDPDDKKNWVASKEFESLCKQSLFLIFDESHHTKNASMSHFACAALVKMAKKYPDSCRVALLSHTPGDKTEHCVQLLRMAGIVTSTKMFKHIPFTSDFEIEKYGLGELRRLCEKMAPERKEELRGLMTNLSKAKSLVIAKKLYDDFIRSKITFAMPIAENNYKVELLNVFLETDENSLLLLQNGIDMLTGAVNWQNGQVGDANGWALNNITNSLAMIEKGKLLSIARYVNQESKKFKNKKFIISCGARGIENHEILRRLIYRETEPEEYIDIINELRQKNSSWRSLHKDVIIYHLLPLLCVKKRPDVLNGTVSKEDRVKIVGKFQENTADSWCLIASPGIASESLSLHDKHGDFPREMLIVPDYYFSRVHQNCGRVNRVGMKSDAKVMIVYSKEAALETSILQSMIQKTKTARDMIAEGQKVLYPGEFPFWIEGKKDRDLEEELLMLQGRI